MNKVTEQSGYGSEHEVWKVFNENQITHSMAHYLMAIDEMSTQGERKGCKAADIARLLNVSRNAVSLKLKAMQHHNLILLSEDRLVNLTPMGIQAVNDIVITRRSMKRFLTEFLGVPDQLAEQDSCKVEHLLSKETRTKLAKLVQFMTQTPEFTQNFMQAFKTYQVQCEQDEDKYCPLCQHSCLLAE